MDNFSKAIALENIKLGIGIPSDTLEDLCIDLLVPLTGVPTPVPYANVMVLEYINSNFRTKARQKNTHLFAKWAQLRVDADG